MKNVMKRAWEIAKNAAKKFGHSVKSYFAMSLKMAWTEAKAPKAQKPVSERIEELEAKGFKRWQKGGMDRLYINANVLGLVVHYRKTGSICDAWFNEESISHAEGGRMKMAKTFIDVKTGVVYSDNETLKRAAEKLVEIGA